MGRFFFLRIHELNGLYLGTDDPEDAALFYFPNGKSIAQGIYGICFLAGALSI
jgi:hypothetical protein